jgi:class 3 adenylate cyclase
VRVELRDEFGVHRLTLRFRESLEDEFDAYRLDRTLVQLRIGLLAAAGIIAVALISLALANPNGDGFWLRPSPRLFAYWSTVLANLLGLGLILMRATPNAVTLAMAIPTVWFLIVITSQTAADSGLAAHLSFLPILALILFACTLAEFDFVVFLPFTALAVIAAGGAVLHRGYAPGAVEAFVFFLAGSLLSLVAGYCIERHQRREYILRRQLATEHERSEALLLNVLPKPIADRLRAGVGTIADRFDQCSVLFADVVGFTELAARLKPEEAVLFLNSVFSAFDDLADRHGLEKIKTIGDSYMVVGGVPTPRNDHVSAMADMALDMLDALAGLNREHGWELTMRIGIASGPVVAGVIGQRKFAYDLWGDTVNTASRMESHGLPGAIQVTEDVYTLLRGQYLFSARGDIEVKGKGTMPTYLLTGRLTPAALDQALPTAAASPA